MQIRKVQSLLGPNIWTNRSVLEAWVDLGHYEELPSNLLPGFNRRLESWLPTLIEHRCSEGVRGGFLQRLARGTWLGHVLEHVTLELQSLAHSPVGFGRARETNERGVYKVVIECKDPVFGQLCLQAGHRLVLAAAEQREFDVQSELAELTRQANRCCLSASTQAIVSAAEARGIPAIRLRFGPLGPNEQGTDDLVQLGYGSASQRVGSSETQRSSAVGQAIAADWELCRRLLGTIGIPVAEASRVRTEQAAWQAAEELGLPVDLRTRGADPRSCGPLRTRAEVARAFETLAQDGSRVFIEPHSDGRRFSVLVVGERAVAASERRGGEDEAHFVDVTDSVHSDVAATCVLAAETVGLDIAAIELKSSDIGVSLQQSGGVVVDVVARPDLQQFLRASGGAVRPVGEAVVDHLFESRDTPECRVVAVSGTAGKSNTVGLLGEMLAAAGRRAGVASSLGLRISGQKLADSDHATFDGARRVLTNPSVDVALLEVDEADVLRSGLAFSRCDVAIVTNLAQGDHLGQQFVADVEVVRKAIRTPADVVTPSGSLVVNADEPRVLDMDERCRGKVIGFSSQGRPNVNSLLARGCKAVIAEHGKVVLLDGQRSEVLLNLEELACPVFGLPEVWLENLLAAVGGAVALGLPRQAIERGVAARTGEGGVAWYESGTARVLLSPARSLLAVERWAVALQTRFTRGRHHALVHPPTDWRTEDAERLGVLLAQFFSIGLVGLDPGAEASVAFVSGQCKQGRDVPDAFETLEAALPDRLSRLGPEDLLFVQLATRDQYQRALALVESAGFNRGKIGGLASVESCR